MTWSELERKLRRETMCRFFEHRNGHDWWLNPQTGEQFKMGRHASQEVPTRVLHNILKAAGLK
ncbi:MAG: type II toxin-antitoxin system HicA family toxin [Selenomonadaceae bacterium]|nr:type II toxin-antitoxin system HicA family toxin [Selenomonadaceae bacterium]MBQ7628800.1 type II toxin-antitoxin system HicA family toxin [Selenomonadaceae bacterium]